jgi:hypothetical protein
MPRHDRDESHRRTRSKSRRHHRRSRSQSRSRSRSRRYRTRSRSHGSDSAVKKTLGAIMSRLDAIEGSTTSASQTPLPPNHCPTPKHDDNTPSVAQVIADALVTFNQTKPQNYYVSNFDPSIHNFEAWCSEVERARSVNRWSELECLSRVAHCLKGDAKTWLNEWTTNDRSWSNFVKEFKSLCPRKHDFANILFEVMTTTSDKFPTYAEYARRSLLRLRVVQGLSEELMVQIVIRGITDAQVRAAAANADLTTENLVSFLAIYVKASRNKFDNRLPSSAIKKRNFDRSATKCFSCGQTGHLSFNCPRKQKPSEATPRITCNFCKKPGHKENDCFAKTRSNNQNANQRNVNLCTELSNALKNNDICTAVVQGIPVDVLIDSGALNVSLISSSVVKYFSGPRKQVNCVLKGISTTEIIAHESISLTVELSNIALDVDFVIVPSTYMNTPIIIGTDVLNRDGVTFIRTKHGQYLTHAPVTNKINSVVTIDKVNTPLQGPEYNLLMSVIDSFAPYLISGTASTTVKTGKMKINVTSDAPIAYHPYRLSYQEKLKVREIVGDLLDKNIIRESDSEYASPVILVKKKDGSDRMCVDFRALNRITVKDRYPLPLIEDHIDRLGGSKYFTSLDMASGFHQIPIDEPSIHKTGFVTPEGHYEYLKMPFGLCNSPTVYQRIINNTLRKFIEAGNVLVYIDDVLLLSMSVKEGINLLLDVLKTLTEAGFSINLKKCSFLTTEVEYLGRVISHGQVRPSPRKIDALVNAPVPANVKQVRQFLGLAGYFRRYIKDYATKTASISRLTKKDIKFQWGSEQEHVRQDLVKSLTSEPILAIFDPNLATELHTDASSVGYGAVLLQTHSGGNKRVVAYYSKVTQGAESRYHSYELETLAVVKALQHFRHYLIGVEFKIVTDCNALKATERKKDLLPRVARWWIYLQDYNFTIEYRKGQLMGHADYLSRNPLVAQVNYIDRPLNWAQMAQSADCETQDLIQKLRDGHLDSNRYTCQNDLLYYRFTPIGEEPRLLCFVPKGHRLSLLRIFHDEHEHIGSEKTLDLILKHFWFPGLRQFVIKYTSHCLICISRKRVPRAPLQPTTSWPKSEIPFNTVHADVLGPLPESNGFKFVFVLVDSFTKFCLLLPMYRQDTHELKRVFDNAVALFGVPKLLICDRGRMFEASSFTKWMTDIGCDIHYITPEMHQANGQAERYVRTVLNLIRVHNHIRNSSWSDALCKIQLVLNITKQKSTQLSALNLLIGTDATTPVIRSLIRDVAVENANPNREAWREICRERARVLLDKNRRQQDSYVNRNRRSPRVFKKDDHVFVIKYSQSTGKLDSGMRGPYRVTKTLPSDRYELKLLGGARGKTTQAAAQYMIPWKGEWCPESCAAFFDSEFYCVNMLQIYLVARVCCVPVYDCRGLHLVWSDVLTGLGGHGWRFIRARECAMRRVLDSGPADTSLYVYWTSVLQTHRCMCIGLRSCRHIAVCVLDFGLADTSLYVYWTPVLQTRY